MWETFMPWYNWLKGLPYFDPGWYLGRLALLMKYTCCPDRGQSSVGLLPGKE